MAFLVVFLVPKSGPLYRTTSQTRVFRPPIDSRLPWPAPETPASTSAATTLPSPTDDGIVVRQNNASVLIDNPVSLFGQAGYDYSSPYNRSAAAVWGLSHRALPLCSPARRLRPTGPDARLAPMPILVGTPSDDVPEILATGRPRLTTLYVSMSGRHPEGRDADYLQWQTLDHRPEQNRLASVRSSPRIVSTPRCRAVRAVHGTRYNDVDHVMTYFFSDSRGRDDFEAGSGLSSRPALGGDRPGLPESGAVGPGEAGSITLLPGAHRVGGRQVGGDKKGVQLYGEFDEPQAGGDGLLEVVGIAERN
jgi:hypothetical protein